MTEALFPLEIIGCWIGTFDGARLPNEEAEPLSIASASVSFP
jgi:hypothetical protein